MDAAKALAFLHAKGIIHRDVKSKNFLVDENMKVKICDFGFARTASSQKRPMTICGTNEWMVIYHIFAMFCYSSFFFLFLAY